MYSSAEGCTSGASLCVMIMRKHSYETILMAADMSCNLDDKELTTKTCFFYTFFAMISPAG